jgi:hypothetical protein
LLLGKSRSLPRRKKLLQKRFVLGSVDRPHRPDAGASRLLCKLRILAVRAENGEAGDAQV